MLYIQPRSMQITGKRPPERMRAARQPGLLLKPVQHDLNPSSPHAPDIDAHMLTTRINLSNP